MVLCPLKRFVPWMKGIDAMKHNGWFLAYMEDLWGELMFDNDHVYVNERRKLWANTNERNSGPSSVN